METYRYNTLRFFRVQFGLPARMPLEWCVVRETSRAGSELRLGVALKGTGLYIDVAMRRFFSQIDIPLIERRCYPAERISRGDDYEYRSAEGWSFTSITFAIFITPRDSAANCWRIACCEAAPGVRAVRAGR